MPATAGSIAEYDAVLSVSEEAINRQLKVLYETTIVGPAPVTEIEGFVAIPRSKHLINHDVRIRPTKIKDGVVKPSKEGLIGHIRAPTVSFKDMEPGYVQLTMEFMEDPTVTSVADLDLDITDLPSEVTKKPSNSWVMYTSEGDLEVKNINKWTMQWRAKMDRKEIQNVMEDLVKPAKSPESNVAITQGLVDKLEKVASEDFLVSSIFCVIETHDFMDHFVLKDENNKDVVGVDTDAWSFFAARLSAYWLNMKTKQGIPNPNSPFILGYGISQKLPTLKNSHPELNTENTPKYFIPKNFHFSTTKGSGLTNGTLNFLMLTHREDAQEERTVKDPGAGILPKDLFTKTRSRAEKSDAIMAFCSDAFWDRWVKGVLLPTVHISVRSSFDSFWNSCHGLKSSETKYDRQDSGPQRVQDGQHPTWKYKDDWRTAGTNIVDIELGGCDVWQEGTSETTIELHSTLADDYSGVSPLPDDAERKVSLVIRWNYHIKGMFETFGPFRIGGTSEAYDQEIRFAFKEVIELSTKGESAGNWTATQRAEGTTMPSSVDEFNTRLQHDFGGEAMSGETDNIAGTKSTWHGVVRPFNLKDYLHFFPALPSMLAPAACWARDSMMRNLGNAFNGMEFQVMMPGGEAFFFKGLDTDAEANIYSHLCYKMGAADAKRT